MMSSDWSLITLALAGIGVLVGLVTLARLNAFLALMIAALIVGGGAGKPMLDIARAFQDGLGATLGGTAAVICLGTMLGKLLAESRGAEVLAKQFAKFFGPRRIGWCIVAIALVVGLTTWFAVGLIILTPILHTLTRETKRPFLHLALPLLSFLSVMHGVMPPHPGPVMAINALHANTGKVMLWGFLIGIPTAAVAGPVFARIASKRLGLNASHAALPPLHPGARWPHFGLTMFSMLLPVALMLLATLADLVAANGTFRTAADFIGNPTVALLIAVLFAHWSLGTRCGFAPKQLLKFGEDSVAGVGMMIMIVGGGGGFARVLQTSGVAGALGGVAAAAHLSPLLYGWLVSAFIRVATGSATVSITTASALLVPVIAQHPGTNIELVVVAIGCGSLFLSHLNDGGFWIVKDCLNLTVPETFKTWSICETIIGVVGLLLALLASALI
ncbi:MAG TPA: gluconate:H+ symporter [Verrucomicrobiae bacterium]|jgi:GntP family gluconate:H+ symporter|nr:gluconate:H+ symporter [Verrucomicrobiae bacterium]